MKYRLDDIIKVQITSIVPYGIFVNADYGYTGLIHISEITGGYVKDISKYFKVGNELEAKIIGIDEEKKHLSLSTKNIMLDILIDNENDLKEEGLGFDKLRDKEKKIRKRAFKYFGNYAPHRQNKC